MSSVGKFLTLEGGEGTGKSTLIDGLARVLGEQGQAVVLTREPGGTELAEAIRSLALKPPSDVGWSPLAHALLMNTARDDHLNKLIRPALSRGDWVISDRFADSTRAYQSIDGVAMKTLLDFEKVIVGTTKPDLTLILDAPPPELMQRRRNRGTKDVFENKTLEFHDQVRHAFLDIARREPDRCVVIDALGEPEQVLQDALKIINARLAKS